MSATPLTAAVPAATLRGRIGDDARSGHWAVPYRYRLHLSRSCPHCLRIAVTHSLLGLDDTLPVTLLPAVPDAPDGGHSALRPLYEASAHQHSGPAVAPVLSDGWTGRIVSNHAPDILHDLVHRFGDGSHAAEAGTEDVDDLCERGVNEAAQRAGQWDTDPAAREAALHTLCAALDALERRLRPGGPGPWLLGDCPTAADVQLWTTLVQLDTVHRWHLDAAAVHRVADHPRLWEYARRLAAHPSFGPHLDLRAISRRHHAHCRGDEAAGAAIHIISWPETVSSLPGLAERPAVSP